MGIFYTLPQALVNQQKTCEVTCYVPFLNCLPSQNHQTGPTTTEVKPPEIRINVCNWFALAKNRTASNKTTNRVVFLIFMVLHTFEKDLWLIIRHFLWFEFQRKRRYVPLLYNMNANKMRIECELSANKSKMERGFLNPPGCTQIGRILTDY